MIKDYKGAKLYYLPWYDKENIVFLDLARVIDLSFRVLQEKIDIVDRNLFINTALEALDLYQRDLGLQISEEVSIEQKRKIIQGYLHYLHEQTTEEVVRELAESYGNETSVVELKKALEVDVFDIFMNFDLGTTVNYKDLSDVLKKVLPAHLLFILNVVARTKQNLYTAQIHRKQIELTYPVYQPTDIIHDINLLSGINASQRMFEFLKVASEDLIKDKYGNVNHFELVGGE